MKVKSSKYYTLLHKVMPCLVIALIAFICIHAGWGLKADLGGDATQNFLSSYNFYSSFEYGHHIGQAGFRREPLPNWTLAVFLWLFFRPTTGLDRDEVLANTDILDAAVSVNIFWALLLFIGLWALARQIFANILLADFVAFVSIAMSNMAFVRSEYESLNTELAASALLVLVAVSLINAVNQRTILAYFAVGFSYGLLVLTKASGAYIAFMTMPLIALVLAKTHSVIRYKLIAKFLTTLLCIALGFSLIISPWILRNYFEFGKAAIAEGGGRVLWIRAEFNKITPYEFLGAFYAYSPKLLRESLWQPYSGFNADQLECGGNLQLHNRGQDCDFEHLQAERFDQVISLYERGKKALPSKAKSEAVKSGLRFNVDESGKQEFFLTVREKPLHDLLLTVPLAWRGIWSFSFLGYPGLFFNFLIMINLIFMPLIALVVRNNILLLTSLVPAAYFWFYALLSQFWPRFAEPFIPIATLIFCYTATIVVRRFTVKSSFGLS